MKKKVNYLPVNAVECLSCGMYLLSLSRHDYRACKCGTMVDGGFDYQRRGWAADKTPQTAFRELELYVIR